jgi:ferredoxin
MKKFRVNADIVEINRYDFVVEAETQEQAETKLRRYLESNTPSVYQSEPINDVLCTDCEAGMESREVETIKFRS